MGSPEEPLISVLLPAFNGGSALDVALRSVERQTEPRWECLIVDDGSTDETAERAQRAAGRDPRFRLVSLPHRGLIEALNAGLEQCAGTYVARMDADDIMHRHRLRLQSDMLQGRPALTAVGCHVRLFPRDELRNGRRDYERWLNGITTPKRLRAEAFVECPIAHPTLMIRTERLRALRYRDRDWPEDYDLVLRLLANGDALDVVPRRLLLWRDTPGRLSRIDARYGLDRFTACKAAFLADGLLARQEQYVLWGYGDTARTLHRALQTYGKRAAYIVDVDPGRIGQTIHGARVVEPDALRSLPRFPLVASVAGQHPRTQIRAFLTMMGFRENDDFVCAA